MKKITTSLCVVVAAAFLAAAAARRPPALSPTPPPPAAYTLVQRQTYTPAGGQPYLRAEKRRYQRSDGLFVLSHTYYRKDGSVESEEAGLGVPGVGVFRADARAEKWEFLAPLDEDAPRATEDQLRADPAFDREETVAGQRVLVARHCRRSDATDCREVWRAPTLQNCELKTVVSSPRGEETVEPVEVRLGEPEAAPFRRLAHYAKSFARFEGHIRAAESAGDAVLAARLRADLQRARR